MLIRRRFTDIHDVLFCLLCLLTFGNLFSQPSIGEETEISRQFSAIEIEYFEKKIRPLLAKHCYSCHSTEAKTVHGGLKLDSAHSLLLGGDTGPAIVPGKPDESLLIQSILYGKDADYQMPPKGKISEPEIAELTAWVKRGAPFPADTASPALTDKKIDFEKAKQFWSFMDVEKQPLPATTQQGWARQRIDHFILAAMEKQQLSPSQQASREVMLRRLSFDLIGLPPTPAEVQAFVEDASPDAYKKQVERLLASPHFGERWGRLWLDLARYTDRTASWLEAPGDPYLYRDWVIQAMNEDMPYDQFVIRQLATDMLEETGAEDNAALGFVGLSPSYWKELKLPSEIIKVIVADEWEERIDAVSRTFLGLTVACARCHDHKFDPITVQDYYAFAGVFASTHIQGLPTIEPALYEPVKIAKEKVAALETKLKELKKKKPVPEEEMAAVTKEIETTKTSTPHYDAPLAPGLVDEALFVERLGETPQSGSKIVYKPQAQNLNIFIRGNPNRLGEEVPRRFLQVLSKGSSKPYQQASGRLELAESIVNDAASLTARVIVNRIWRAHFGRGLVTTPSNFGISGDAPSHPELLDDLAVRFIEEGWSLKKLHREIVLSATYRQSSRADEDSAQLDPENIWLSRMNKRRLPIESWRDAMLSVTKELDPEIGGPSIDLTAKTNLRRTIYATIHRRDMSNILLMHDFPDPTSHNAQRLSTTTALQGLYALNGPLLLDRSEALATRLEKIPETSERIKFAYQLLYSRFPTERELEIGINYLTDETEEEEKAAWRQYTHVLFASNEFLYVN